MRQTSPAGLFDLWNHTLKSYKILLKYKRMTYRSLAFHFCPTCLFLSGIKSLPFYIDFRLVICPPQVVRYPPQVPEHCLLHTRSRGFPSSPGAAPLLVSCPVATVACPVGAQSPSSINLHTCLRGWRLQTTITAVTLHQRVIWLPQALWQTALWHGAEADAASLTGKRPDVGHGEGIHSSSKLIVKDIFMCRLFCLMQVLLAF